MELDELNEDDDDNGENRGILPPGCKAVSQSFSQ